MSRGIIRVDLDGLTVRDNSLAQLSFGSEGIAKIVGSIRGCKPIEGLPACDWHVYAGIGMLIGVLTLPVLALRRLRQSDPATRDSD